MLGGGIRGRQGGGGLAKIPEAIFLIANSCPRCVFFATARGAPCECREGVLPDAGNTIRPPPGLFAPLSPLPSLSIHGPMA